jgi:toxin ParE1/3/4
MKRIRVSDPAELDLDDIWYEIATRSGSIEIATGLIDSITEVFPLFASNPEAGRRRDDIEFGVRSFPIPCHRAHHSRDARPEVGIPF